MDKKNQFNDEREFEKNLFLALKKFGYLFPTNESDVARMEELYGNTAIDMPENLKRIESFESDSPPIKQNVDFKIAAFSSKKNEKFQFPKDENDKNNLGSE